MGLSRGRADEQADCDHSGGRGIGRGCGLRELRRRHHHTETVGCGVNTSSIRHRLDSGNRRAHGHCRGDDLRIGRGSGSEPTGPDRRGFDLDPHLRQGSVCRAAVEDWEDDGRIRITWATTVDTANEFCFRYGLCTGGPDNYIDNDPATSWAVVDCSTATLVRPWGTDPAGSEQTLRRQGPDTWVDVQTGAMLDSSSAGGGAVAESMWNAACNPGIDPYSTTVDWTQADRRNCPVGRLEVATTNGWHVCLSPESTISEGFATNIANAVGAEGQYGGVPSPNGQAYYFACQWQDLGQGSVNFRALRCGLPPTDIVGGGTVDLVPVA